MPSDQGKAQALEASKINGRSYKCPNCGGIARFMGIDFKAPKKSDVKAWSEAKAFILSGKVYYRGSKGSAAEG